MKVVSIGTLKGGSGKTSVIYNLAGILSETNKVLLIDVDPQCNLSTDVGIDVTSRGLLTVRNIFEDNYDFDKLIFKSPIDNLPNLDIIPSSIALAATELKIVSVAGREQMLRNFVLDNQTKLSEYDYILIDTNPSMSIINQNAFFVSDSIILVSDVSLNGIQGAELFIALWADARRQLRLNDNVKALIINNFDKRIKLSGELFEYCKENDFLKEIFIEIPIPSTVKVKETELEHEPINLLYKNSNVHRAFIEVFENLKLKDVF